MVRAHALPRPAGFALLTPASGPRLDPARIVTLSGTIALNLLAMGLLMMPLSLPQPAEPIENEPRTVYDWIQRKPPEPVPVEIVRHTPAPPARATISERQVAPAPGPAVSEPALVESATQPATAAGSEHAVPADSAAVADAVAAPMQLQYRLAPAPGYPRRALQQRLVGTVLLRVLVGIDGRPLQVEVAQSSGHRELDEAARVQVLKRWSFQPATKDGVGVQAIGMVPIEFALRN